MLFALIDNATTPGQEIRTPPGELLREVKEIPVFPDRNHREFIWIVQFTAYG